MSLIWNDPMICFGCGRPFHRAELARVRCMGFCKQTFLRCLGCRRRFAVCGSSCRPEYRRRIDVWAAPSPPIHTPVEATG